MTPKKISTKHSQANSIHLMKARHDSSTQETNHRQMIRQQKSCSAS